jgi:hypothetical protein
MPRTAKVSRLKQSEEDFEQYLAEAIAAGIDIDDLQQLVNNRLELLGTEDNEPRLVLISDDRNPFADLDPQQAPAPDGEVSEPEPEQKRQLIDILERCKGNMNAARGLANWVLRKLNAAEKRHLENEAYYGEEVEKLDACLARSKNEVERTRCWANWLLENFMRAVFALTGENILILPAGKLRLKPNKDHKKWNEADCLAYLLTRPDVDQLTKRTPSISAVNNIIERRDDGKYYLKDAAPDAEPLSWVYDEAPKQAHTFVVE